MLKDNAFMTAYHKAEELYGPDIIKWPEDALEKMHELSGSNDNLKRPHHVRPAKFAKTSRTLGTPLLLINYRNPTKILGSYRSVDDMTSKRGITKGKIQSYRKNVMWGRCDLNDHQFVAIYQGERCTLSNRPELNVNE